MDSQEDSAATSRMLADEGQMFQTRSAASLLEALNFLADRGFDIIVSELNLPDSHGLATFEALRLHTRDIPIVVMTTAANEQLAFSAVEHGAQDYLIKGRVTTKALTRV
ncbi:MAG: response regulator, partial [Bryobacteraceae bacterium]